MHKKRSKLKWGILNWSPALYKGLLTVSFENSFTHKYAGPLCFFRDEWEDVFALRDACMSFYFLRVASWIYNLRPLKIGFPFFFGFFVCVWSMKNAFTYAPVNSVFMYHEKMEKKFPRGKKIMNSRQIKFSLTLHAKKKGPFRSKDKGIGNPLYGSVSRNEFTSLFKFMHEPIVCFLVFTEFRKWPRRLWNHLKRYLVQERRLKTNTCNRVLNGVNWFP